MNDRPYTFVTDGVQSKADGNSRVITGWAMAEGDDTEGGGFTKSFMKSFLEQVKSKKIIIDSEHLAAFDHNVKMYLQKIIDKTGINVQEVKGELNKIMDFARLGALPIAKIFDAYEKDGQIELVTKTNPAFAEVDEIHNKYYNSFLKSLDQKFIDGYSLTFVPTRYKFEDGKKKIDDGIVKTVSLTGGRSNPNTSLTAVAYRCANDLPEVEFNNKEYEVRMSMDTPTKDQLDAIIEQNKRLQAQIDAKNKEEADRKASEELAAKQAEEARIKAEAEAKAQEAVNAQKELEALRAKNEELERQAAIAAAQNTANAGSKRIAPQGRDPLPQSNTDNTANEKRVLDYVKKLSTNNTIERKPQTIMRQGRVIKDEDAFKRDLAEMVQLQADVGPYKYRKGEQSLHLRKSNSDFVIPSGK